MKFKGQPNLSVTTNQKVGAINRYRSVGTFDENGIMELDDTSPFIPKMKLNYEVVGENKPIEKIKVQPTIGIAIKKCKKCDFTCTSQGDLLAHYRKTHPKKKE